MANLKYVAALAAALMASPALAADPAGSAPAAASPWDLAFGAKIANDYNFRGISQSDRGISGGGYAELRYNWAYVGAAFWSTKLPNQPLGEVDLYFGVRPVVGPVTFDFGAMYYWYPNEKPGVAALLGTQFPSSFWELYGKVSYDVTDQFNVGTALYYAPNWLNTGAPGTYLNLTAKYKLPYDFAVSGEVGRYFLGTQTNFAVPAAPVALASYFYWNAGVSYTYKEAFTIDARYHGTNLSDAECYTNTGDPAGSAGGSTPGRSKWCGHSFILSLTADLQWSKLPLK